MRNSIVKSRVICLSIALSLVCLVSRGQFLDCTSGLLQTPTAVMNQDGTFMITGNYLNSHATADNWDYDTFGYGLSITIFSRVEVAYVMAILDGKKKKNPTERDLIMINQDRHFAAKFLLLREGELWDWTPSIAVGFSDPISATNDGYKDASEVSSGYFNRFFLAVSKGFDSRVGRINAHVGYQYNNPRSAKLYHYNSPCAAIDWAPIWLQKPNLISTKLIAEYDARTFNVGAILSLWRDHFDIMIELQAMKFVSAGIRYKMIIKKQGENRIGL